MKNIILGILGCMIAVYTIVSCLSIYSISTRKNEMENCISQVLEQNLLNYYGSESTDAEVKTTVVQDLSERLQADSKVQINVHTCNIKQGILSVDLCEEFYLPIGISKTIRCSKTVIAEEEVVESEVESSRKEKE